METLKNSSWFELDWLDQFCIWAKRPDQTSFSQSTFCPDTWLHLPINTGYAKNDFCDIFRIQKNFKLIHTNEASYDLVG